jgi:hypothetical protein
MKILFSKRHEEALRNRTLDKHLTFPYKCRVAIERVLSDKSDYGNWIDEDGLEWRDANTTYFIAEDRLKTFYGINKLQAFDEDDKRSDSSFRDVLLSGYPSEVLDAIEAWFDSNQGTATDCEREINEVLYIHNSAWRFINGNAVLIESEYHRREIQAKTIELLKINKAYGALEEFQEAINDLTASETKDAVVNAHKSVESTMKVVLGTGSEKLRFGQLLRQLIDSQIIPEYYEEFFKNFEQLVVGVGKERNLPGRGHGQGSQATDVHKNLAEFTVNLAGSINLFLLRHLTSDNEDIPFSP